MADEWTVAVIDQAMRSGDASARRAVLQDYADTPAGALPDRAAAALAAMALTERARTEVALNEAARNEAARNGAAWNGAGLAKTAPTDTARASDAGQRALYRERAASLIGVLRLRRPDWAPTLLLAAQQRLADAAQPRLAGGATAEEITGAIADVTASYTAAPFLRDEALWRIAFGAVYWRSLPVGTREHVLDEAAWLTRTDGGLRPSVEALFGDSPAAVAYELRMADRSSDGSAPGSG